MKDVLESRLSPPPNSGTNLETIKLGMRHNNKLGQLLNQIKSLNFEFNTITITTTSTTWDTMTASLY